MLFRSPRHRQRRRHPRPPPRGSALRSRLSALRSKLSPLFPACAPVSSSLSNTTATSSRASASVECASRCAATCGRRNFAVLVKLDIGAELAWFACSLIQREAAFSKFAQRCLNCATLCGRQCKTLPALRCRQTIVHRRKTKALARTDFTGCQRIANGNSACGQT